jgi:hypothetical protein
VAATDAADARRIRFAAGAIQKELSLQGFIEGPVRGDGHFGVRTTAGIVACQREHKLTPDGLAGRNTLAHLCWDPIEDYELFLKIPDHLLYGQLALESGMDPGAQGLDRRKSTDRGLAQISDEYHPEVSNAQAYGDIRFSIHFTALSMITAGPGSGDSYAARGLWDCAVAAHNNPSKARDWFRDGSPPDEQIESYVRLVRKSGTPPVG